MYGKPDLMKELNDVLDKRKEETTHAKSPKKAKERGMSTVTLADIKEFIRFHPNSWTASNNDINATTDRIAFTEQDRQNILSKSQRRQEVVNQLAQLQNELISLSVDPDEVLLRMADLKKEMLEYKRKYEEQRNISKLLEIENGQLKTRVHRLEREVEGLVIELEAKWRESLPDIPVIGEHDEPLKENKLEKAEEDESEEETEEGKRLHRFRECIKEIITTEMDYVNDLLLIEEVFMRPMVTNKIIGHRDTELLFSNITDIINFNRRLLQEFQEMEESRAPRMNIGEIFLRYAEFFKIYTEYVTNQAEAITTLERLTQKNKQFEQFLSSVKGNPRCRLLPLEAFLMKPVQRICKYPLLLKELTKYTDTTTPLYETLLLAQTKISSVVNLINERRKLAENLAKVLEISNYLEGATRLSLVQPARRFIAESTFVITTSDKSKDRKVFLFNDMLVIAKPGPLKKRTYQYVNRIEFSQIIVRDAPDNPDAARSFEILQIETNNHYLFTARSVEDKEFWHKYIDERIAKAISSPEKSVSPQETGTVRGKTRRTKSFIQLLNLLRKDGYLDKLHGNTWKRRYFELKDGILYRYDFKGGKLLGKLIFSEQTEIDEYKPDIYPGCFEIRGPSKSIVLKCETDVEMHEWLNCIIKNKLLSVGDVEKTVAVDSGARERASFTVSGRRRSVSTSSLPISPQLSPRETTESHRNRASPPLMTLSKLSSSFSSLASRTSVKTIWHNTPDKENSQHNNLSDSP